jgi:hypothetical protein
VVITPSSFSSGSDQDSKAFTITVSLLAVVVFALLVLAAGFWLSSRKWNGLFHRVDLQAGTEAVENPLSMHAGHDTVGHAAAHADVESGDVQMTSVGTNAGSAIPSGPHTHNSGSGAGLSDQADADGHHDDLEEISFSTPGRTDGYHKERGNKPMLGGVGGAVTGAVGAGAARVGAGLRGLRRSVSRVIAPEK